MWLSFQMPSYSLPSRSDPVGHTNVQSVSSHEVAGPRGPKSKQFISQLKLCLYTIVHLLLEEFKNFYQVILKYHMTV